MARVICGGCRVDMERTRDAVSWLSYSHGEPVSLWECAEWRCPRCEAHVLTQTPVGCYYRKADEGFEEEIGHAAARGELFTESDTP